VCIRGFLSRNENTDTFDKWELAHHKLVLKHGWAQRFVGWRWSCGSIQLPMPLASAGNLIYAVLHGTKLLRINPWTLLPTMIFDGLAFSGNVAYEYYKAPKLALDLKEYSKRYENVRVVAHSLGCKWM